MVNCRGRTEILQLPASTDQKWNWTSGLDSRPGPVKTQFSLYPYLGILQPHLQALHGHLSHLFVATGCCQQPEEVPRDVIHGLAPVELVPQHVQDVLLHALCKVVIPGPHRLFYSLLHKLAWSCCIQRSAFFLVCDKGYKKPKPTAIY